MMHRILRISSTERDAILANSYPRMHTVMGNKVWRFVSGWQSFDFEPDGGGIFAPPMEYDIQVGDTVTIWWLNSGHWGDRARAISINGAPPIIYPQEFDLAEGWLVAVNESEASE